MQPSADRSTIYIGGEFTYVGPSTGHGVAIDNTTGNYDSPMPKVNGIIYAVVPMDLEDGILEVNSLMLAVLREIG